MSDLFDVDKLADDAPGQKKCVMCEERFDDIQLWGFRDKVPRQLLKHFPRRVDTATYQYVMCDCCHKFWDDNECIKGMFRIGYVIVDGILGIITILNLTVASPLDKDANRDIRDE